MLVVTVVGMPPFLVVSLMSRRGDAASSVGTSAGRMPFPSCCCCPGCCCPGCSPRALLRAPTNPQSRPPRSGGSGPAVVPMHPAAVVAVSAMVVVVSLLATSGERELVDGEDRRKPQQDEQVEEQRRAPVARLRVLLLDERADGKVNEPATAGGLKEQDHRIAHRFTCHVSQGRWVARTRSALSGVSQEVRWRGRAMPCRTGAPKKQTAAVPATQESAQRLFKVRALIGDSPALRRIPRSPSSCGNRCGA